MLYINYTIPTTIKLEEGLDTPYIVSTGYRMQTVVVSSGHTIDQLVKCLNVNSRPAITSRVAANVERKCTCNGRTLDVGDESTMEERGIKDGDTIRVRTIIWAGPCASSTCCSIL